MDNLRGQFSGDDEPTQPAPGDDGSTADGSAGAAIADAPRAPAKGNDERRMQVRAYNFWASLLGTRAFPDVADLKPETLPDFGPRSVLLDFTQGLESPAIAHLGALLAQECETEEPLRTLDAVPSRSLLSRITDHYMQILANEAPIGFEAEFVNHAGVTILYRGILLPFSKGEDEGSGRIDYIYGVINWKERAGPLGDEAPKPAPAPVLGDDSQDVRPAMLRGLEPLTEWADGPADLGISPVDVFAPLELPPPGFAMDAEPTSFQPEHFALADWLASARDLAAQARGCEERSRQALYDAVGRAYDFALAAAQAPEDLAELLEDAGIAEQSRTPMLPLVKLVFGVDYDKTRLAEYAAAVAQSERLGLARGTLADHLSRTPGGLKAMVRAERRARRGEEGAAPGSLSSERERLASDLRAMTTRPLGTFADDGEEFTVLVARRLPGGEVVLVGEVSGDDALLQRAARHLLG